MAQFPVSQPQGFSLVMANHRLRRGVVLREDIAKRLEVALALEGLGSTEVSQRRRPCRADQRHSLPDESQFLTRPVWIIAEVAKTIERILENCAHAIDSAAVG